MTISAGSDIVAADFVSTSAGAGDSGKVAKLNATGVHDRSFLPLVVETTSGTTHSLTTVAGQKVIVWAKGNVDSNTNDRVISLKYNGVTKDTTTTDGGGGGTAQVPFALMYTETPGAATHDITVTASAGALAEVTIIVLKI